jgi:glycine cleavage system H protein
MNIPENRKYTASHEWVQAEADGTVTIGITDFAQEALGDLVFVELPEVGRTLAAGDSCAVVESAGEVIAVNEALRDAPEQINGDAFSAWMWKMKPAGDTASLMNAEAYAQNIAAQK